LPSCSQACSKNSPSSTVTQIATKNSVPTSSDANAERLPPMGRQLPTVHPYFCLPPHLFVIGVIKNVGFAKAFAQSAQKYGAQEGKIR
jgi:hypothetical protein